MTWHFIALFKPLPQRRFKAIERTCAFTGTHKVPDRWLLVGDALIAQCELCRAIIAAKAVKLEGEQPIDGWPGCWD